MAKTVNDLLNRAAERAARRAALETALLTVERGLGYELAHDEYQWVSVLSMPYWLIQSIVSDINQHRACSHCWPAPLQSVALLMEKQPGCTGESFDQNNLIKSFDGWQLYATTASRLNDRVAVQNLGKIALVGKEDGSPASASTTSSPGHAN